jgi:osmotically-inducible protein OsmY
MKTPNKLTILAVLLLAAGCARENRQARYESPNAGYSPITGATPYAGTESISGNTVTDPNLGSSDGILVTEVREAIHNDPSFVTFAPNIQVTAQGGAVTLMGSVSSEIQKQQLEALVKSRNGVLTVNNQVQISSGDQSRNASSATLNGIASSAKSSQELSAQTSQNVQTTVGVGEPGKSTASPSVEITPTSDQANETTRIYSNSASSPSSSGRVEVSSSSPLNASSAIVAGQGTTTDNAAENKKESSATVTSPQIPQSASPVVSAQITAPTISSADSSGQGAAKDPTQVITGSQSSSTSPADTAGKVSATIPDNAGPEAGKSANVEVKPATTDASSTAASPSLTPTSERKDGRVYSASDKSADSASDSKDATTLGSAVQGTTDTDRTLAQKIMGDLKADTTVGSEMSRVKIMVDSGKVTLRGKVKSEAQKKSIEAAVQKMSGVNNVDNQISVSAAGASASPSAQ